MQAKVLNTFIEREHENHLYKAGEIYPAFNFVATKERIDFLSAVHPTYKKIYLEPIKQPKNVDENKNGYLSIKEIKAALDDAGISYEGLKTRKDLLELLEKRGG